MAFSGSLTGAKRSYEAPCGTTATELEMSTPGSANNNVKRSAARSINNEQPRNYTASSGFFLQRNSTFIAFIFWI